MTEMSNLEVGAAQRPDLSETQEDYLKQIFLLGGEGARVGTQDLARRLRVKPASVTEMIGRLAQLDLVKQPFHHCLGGIANAVGRLQFLFDRHGVRFDAAFSVLVGALAYVYQPVIKDLLQLRDLVLGFDLESLVHER